MRAGRCRGEKPPVWYPHLGVECLIRQLMKLHMHLGCETSLGLKLNVSIEALAVKLGVHILPAFATMPRQVQKQSCMVIVGFSVGEVQQVQN